ncbi:MAG: nucleotidyltransferase family protein [Alphaproteobacteria bacterium]|nr:nucleotidyltransferase family protein [Alphaproteobacteria bacterium]MCW5742621.1 nucleotidyltransferase family protein [Alphaproteobacteria bacterium]
MPVRAQAGTVRALASALRGQALPADWTPLLGLANQHLLTPALWTALDASPLRSNMPPEVVDYLQVLHRLNGERNHVIRAQIVELVGALNEAAIEPMLLKGALTLFAGPYPDIGARMMRDIDLLVPAAARDTAIAVLNRKGYILARGYGEEHHAFGDFARSGSPAAVDLHLELVDPRHLLRAAEVRERATPHEADGVRFFVPSPTDRVVHNFLHAQIHHLGHYYRGEMPVSQLHEFSMLARSFGGSIDWKFIEARLEAHRLGAALRAYVLAATRLFGPSWPLSRRPGLRSRLHGLRCELQAASPVLDWIGVTWGNLSGPLAWHRMRALHGSSGSAFGWRCRHLARFLGKKGAGAGLARLRRLA